MASDRYTTPPAYGTIPPSLYGADYAQLLRQGLPLTVVRSMLSQPSYPEQRTASPDKWADFRGWQDEAYAGRQPPDYGPLHQRLSDADWYRYFNRPREEQSTEGSQPLRSFKKGGKVKKTGVYKLHKGEKVISAKKTKQMDQEASDKALLQKTRYRRQG